VTGLAALEI